MKRTTKIIVTGVLSIGIVTAAAAFGKYKSGGPEAHAEHVVDYLSGRLNLDTTQQQSLEVLKDQLISTAATMHSEFKPLHGELNSLVAAESFDQARALDIVTEKTSAINAAAPEIVTALSQFLDGLDAEQKAEIAKIIENRSKHRRAHKHGWHGKNQYNEE